MAAAFVAAMTGDVSQRRRPQFCHVSLKSRSVSPQSTSTYQNMSWLFFFPEQALATGPSKRNSQWLRLETWEEKRHKIWCTGALFRHNYILPSPLSFACQNITQVTRAVIQLPSKCPAFPFAASAVDGLHNYSCKRLLLEHLMTALKAIPLP